MSNRHSNAIGTITGNEHNSLHLPNIQEITEGIKAGVLKLFKKTKNLSINGISNLTHIGQNIDTVETYHPDQKEHFYKKLSYDDIKQNEDSANIIKEETIENPLNEIDTAVSETISQINEQQETTENNKESSDRLGFWKNELIRVHKQIKEGYCTRKDLGIRGKEDEDEYLKNAWNQIENIAKTAEIECSSQINKRLVVIPEIEKSENKETIKAIKKEVKKYNIQKNKRRRLDQICLRGAKKRAIKTISNEENVLKNLINNPENNRFKYISETTHKIYDVMVIAKEKLQGKGKITYELEAVHNGDDGFHKPFKFAKTIEQNKENEIFKLSDSVKHLESMEEIDTIVETFLAKL